MDLNIMMDPKPMYPDMYHPVLRLVNRNGKGYAKYYSRAIRPRKYYLIDFGISRKYKPSDAPFLEIPIRGGDKSVSEFNPVTRRCDPFATDIYYLGNAIRERFLEVCVSACYSETWQRMSLCALETYRGGIHEPIDRRHDVPSAIQTSHNSGSCWPVCETPLPPGVLEIAIPSSWQKWR